ncbi:hypothetical protein [Stutzerimonas nitrititolerans]|uniref:hypothetical protein n=1 Tax=Stutzerimonas nitrititolerans TaxID=2482751 RepID=UPI0028A27007|nr:hypothetical protein [Stutzerimonas nitrititolerans]
MLKLFQRLFRFDSFNDGYITIVYCGQKQGIIVHDTLSGDSCDSCDSFNSVDRHYSDTPAQDLGLEPSFDHGFVFSEPLIDHGPLFLTNPATGLPMVDNFVDAGGNTFGFGGDNDPGW